MRGFQMRTTCPVPFQQLNITSRGSSAHRKMVDVSTAPPEQIHEEHQRLRREHEQLMERLDELHGKPFDVQAHRQFMAALAAHLTALQAHSAKIHGERERLDQQRAIFEAQKPRDTPTQRRRPTRRKLAQRKATNSSRELQ